jgi:hypothetical protein
VEYVLEAGMTGMTRLLVGYRLYGAVGVSEAGKEASLLMLMTMTSLLFCWS